MTHWYCIFKFATFSYNELIYSAVCNGAAAARLLYNMADYRCGRQWRVSLTRPTFWLPGWPTDVPLAALRTLTASQGWYHFIDL
jgi:hypothetical protein